MSKPSLDLKASAKLWPGPDLSGEPSSGEPEDGIRFITAQLAVIECMTKLGERKLGARIETVDGTYDFAEIEAAYLDLVRSRV